MNRPSDNPFPAPRARCRGIWAAGRDLLRRTRRRAGRPAKNRPRRKRFPRRRRRSMLRRGRRRGIGHEPAGTRSRSGSASRCALVEEAGRLALAHFRQPIAVENKLGPGAFDPVTAADRGVEALIRAGLGRAWPDSPIQGEEEGFTPGASEWSWIIDPIDGTRAFISGVPAWGILLGLLKAGAAASPASCASPTSTRPSSAAPRAPGSCAPGRGCRCAPRARRASARRSSTPPIPASSPTPPSRPASTGSRRRSG